MFDLDVLCFETPFRFSRAAMKRFAEAKKARLVLAEEGGALAGFGILHLERFASERAGYLVTLDVAREQRRKGLGCTLMIELERQAQAAGCTTIALHVYVENDAAMQFYERLGFAASHRVEAFYGRGLDAWVFHKRVLS